jgi:hypothetical protein
MPLCLSEALITKQWYRYAVPVTRSLSVRCSGEKLDISSSGPKAADCVFLHLRLLPMVQRRIVAEPLFRLGMTLGESESLLCKGKARIGLKDRLRLGTFGHVTRAHLRMCPNKGYTLSTSMSKGSTPMSRLRALSAFRYLDRR